MFDLYLDVMTDFSSFSINNVECALITSGWFRRIYPPILLYVNPSRVAMSFSVSVVVPYRRIASAYFSLLCLDIRFPSEVCTIPCRFANSGSCLCRYSLNVSGWSPNSLAAWAIGRGCFLRLPMAFSYLAATVFIRFFDFRKSRPPSALPESRARSLTKSICHLCMGTGNIRPCT